MALHHWLFITHPKTGEELFRSAQGPRVNITDCEQLEMALDESCSFDLQAVKNFTRDIKTGDGWSIGFWVKAVGFESLSQDGKFYPGLSMLHSISPPEPLYAFGKFSGDVVFPASYAGTYGVHPADSGVTNGPYARMSKATASPSFLPPLKWQCGQLLIQSISTVFRTMVPFLH